MFSNIFIYACIMLTRIKKLIVFSVINKYTTYVWIKLLIIRQTEFIFLILFFELQVQMANTDIKILHKIKL